MNTPAKIVKKSDLKNYFSGKKSDRTYEDLSE
jgi:hypothetical protein